MESEQVASNANDAQSESPTTIWSKMMFPPSGLDEKTGQLRPNSKYGSMTDITTIPLTTFYGSVNTRKANKEFKTAFMVYSLYRLAYWGLINPEFPKAGDLTDAFVTGLSVDQAIKYFCAVYGFQAWFDAWNRDRKDDFVDTYEDFEKVLLLQVPFYQLWKKLLYSRPYAIRWHKYIVELVPVLSSPDYDFIRHTGLEEDAEEYKQMLAFLSASFRAFPYLLPQGSVFELVPQTDEQFDILVGNQSPEVTIQKTLLAFDHTQCHTGFELAVWWSCLAKPGVLPVLWFTESAVFAMSFYGIQRSTINSKWPIVAPRIETSTGKPKTNEVYSTRWTQVWRELVFGGKLLTGPNSCDDAAIETTSAKTSNPQGDDFYTPEFHNQPLFAQDPREFYKNVWGSYYGAKNDVNVEDTFFVELRREGRRIRDLNKDGVVSYPMQAQFKVPIGAENFFSVYEKSDARTFLTRASKRFGDLRKMLPIESDSESSHPSQVSDYQAPLSEKKLKTAQVDFKSDVAGLVKSSKESNMDEELSLEDSQDESLTKSKANLKKGKKRNDGPKKPPGRPKMSAEEKAKNLVKKLAAKAAETAANIANRPAPEVVEEIINVLSKESEQQQASGISAAIQDGQKIALQNPTTVTTSPAFNLELLDASTRKSVLPVSFGRVISYDEMEPNKSFPLSADNSKRIIKVLKSDIASSEEMEVEKVSEDQIAAALKNRPQGQVEEGNHWSISQHTFGNVNNQLVEAEVYHEINPDGFADVNPEKYSLWLEERKKRENDPKVVEAEREFKRNYESIYARGSRPINHYFTVMYMAQQRLRIPCADNLLNFHDIQKAQNMNSLMMNEIEQEFRQQDAQIQLELAQLEAELVDTPDLFTEARLSNLCSTRMLAKTVLPTLENSDIVSSVVLDRRTQLPAARADGDPIPVNVIYTATGYERKVHADAVLLIGSRKSMPAHAVAKSIVSQLIDRNFMTEAQLNQLVPSAEGPMMNPNKPIECEHMPICFQGDARYQITQATRRLPAPITYGKCDEMFEKDPVVHIVENSYILRSMQAQYTKSPSFNAPIGISLAFPLENSLFWNLLQYSYLVFGTSQAGQTHTQIHFADRQFYLNGPTECWNYISMIPKLIDWLISPNGFRSYRVHNTPIAITAGADGFAETKSKPMYAFQKPDLKWPVFSYQDAFMWSIEGVEKIGDKWDRKRAHVHMIWRPYGMMNQQTCTKITDLLRDIFGTLLTTRQLRTMNQIGYILKKRFFIATTFAVPYGLEKNHCITQIRRVEKSEILDRTSPADKVIYHEVPSALFGNPNVWYQPINTQNACDDTRWQGQHLCTGSVVYPDNVFCEAFMNIDYVGGADCVICTTPENNAVTPIDFFDMMGWQWNLIQMHTDNNSPAYAAAGFPKIKGEQPIATVESIFAGSCNGRGMFSRRIEQTYIHFVGLFSRILRSCSYAATTEDINRFIAYYLSWCANLRETFTCIYASHVPGTPIIVKKGSIFKEVVFFLQDTIARDIENAQSKTFLFLGGQGKSGKTTIAQKLQGFFGFERDKPKAPGQGTIGRYKNAAINPIFFVDEINVVTVAHSRGVKPMVRGDNAMYCFTCYEEAPSLLWSTDKTDKLYNINIFASARFSGFPSFNQFEYDCRLNPAVIQQFANYENFISQVQRRQYGLILYSDGCTVSPEYAGIFRGIAKDPNRVKGLSFLSQYIAIFNNKTQYTDALGFTESVQPAVFRYLLIYKNSCIF